MQIKVIAPEYGIETIATKNMDDVSIATISFSLGFDITSQTQDSAYFDEETGEIKIRTIPMKSFGGIKMKVYYFDEAARRRYRKEFPNNQIDGVKIYRDSIITTPFAENESEDDKKRDVLGIDKRLWMNIFDRVSTREIIGIVEITKKDNPMIIDATNRQDFVDNEQYRDLKEFIITQLDAIEGYKKYSRKKKRKENSNTLESAGQEIQSFISSVENIAEQNPNLKDSLAPVVEQAKKTGKAVRTAIKEKKEAEEEFARKESVYMSIMSLQEYAIHITHAVRTTLNKIRDTTTRTTEGLVSSCSYDVSVLNWVFEQTGSDKTCRVRHINHKDSAYFVGNLADASVVPFAAVSRSTSDDEFRLVFASNAFELVVVNATVAFLYVVFQCLVVDTRHINW